MQGSIYLESKVDEGSSFTVVFPLAESKKEIISKNHSALSNVLPKQTETRKKVLIVDDDDATRQIIELFLEQEFKVVAASNGQDALNLLNTEKFTIVLLDISLGNSYNGVELLKDLRTIPFYKDIPVMAVTAHAMVGDKARFLASGFDDYLSKPFGKEDLVKKVHYWLDSLNRKEN
jgi:CheY-like chemotaxis protein